MNVAHRPLVIDKSYAHKVSAARLAALSKDYLILIPSAFFYEVAKTELSKRWKATKSFPEFDMLHLPTLLRKETSSGKPLVEIGYTAHHFDDSFIDGSRYFSETENAAFTDYETDHLAERIKFFREVVHTGVIGYSGADMRKVVQATLEEFTAVCRRLRDEDQIRKMCETIKLPISQPLDKHWLHYRYIQGLAIYGLALIRSYHGQIEMLTDELLKDEIHDLEYLVLGLHVGNLATDESELKYQKMGWKFRVLAPDRILIKY